MTVRKKRRRKDISKKRKWERDWGERRIRKVLLKSSGPRDEGFRK